MPWCPSGSAFLRGRHGTRSAAFPWQAWVNEQYQGFDIWPGVPRDPHFLRHKCGIMRVAKGLDIRFDLRPARRFLRTTREIMCTAKGSDICPGVPRAPRFLRTRHGTMLGSATFA